MFGRKNGDRVRSQSKPRPPTIRRAGVEALESRRLLSTTLLDGVLTINGSMEADTVTLSMSGGDLLVNDLGFLKTLLGSTVTSVVINLGLDNDTCTIDSSVILPVTVYGGAGNDVISGGSGNDTLYGAHPSITPNGSDNDVINGNGGDDVIIGGAGADVMNGGFGLDEVSYAAHGASVSVYLDGSANDGSAGEGDNVGGDVEIVRGSAFDDILNATNRSNGVKLYGGAGHDLLESGTGDDELYGEAGNDILSAHGGHDYLDGADGSDRLYGGSGDDQLFAGAGDDWVVEGNDGNDWLHGYLGADYLIGGNGTDTTDYREKGSGVTIHTDNDPKDGTVGEGDNVYIDVEIIWGTNHNDVLNCTGAQVPVTIYGLDGNDLVEGGFNNDTIYGGGGDDTLSGQAGDDTLEGGGGNDTIIGGNGHDTLRGDNGDDLLTGEMGNDIIIGGQGLDRMYGGNGNDVFYARDFNIDTLIDGGADNDSLQRDLGEGFYNIETLLA